MQLELSPIRKAVKQHLDGQVGAELETSRVYTRVANTEPARMQAVSAPIDVQHEQ